MGARLAQAWRAMGLAARVGVIAGALLAIGAIWTFSPALYDRRVDEAFPVGAAAPTTPPAPTALPPTALPPTAEPTAAPAPTTPSVPTAPTATAAPSATVAPTELPAPTALPPTAPPATAAPAGPVALAQGSFIKGSIRGDEAEGSATIFRLEDGRLLLRLEDFAATNGPDLVVAFHPAASPEQEPGEYLVIAGLKGNQGNQNYELPADLDLSRYRSVVIWCRTFDVVFGYAALM